jgi:hypothetical protein
VIPIVAMRLGVRPSFQPGFPRWLSTYSKLTATLVWRMGHEGS